MVIAVCKDSVTMLTTIEKEQLNFEQMSGEEKSDFKEVLLQFIKQNPQKNFFKLEKNQETEQQEQVKEKQYEKKKKNKRKDEDL